jgi:hypothetical protein
MTLRLLTLLAVVVSAEAGWIPEGVAKYIPRRQEPNPRLLSFTGPVRTSSVATYHLTTASSTTTAALAFRSVVFQSPPARHSRVLSLAHVHQPPLQPPPSPPPPPPLRASVQDCDLCEDMIPSMREAERLTGRKIRTFNVGATTADYELFRGLDEGEW